MNKEMQLITSKLLDDELQNVEIFKEQLAENKFSLSPSSFKLLVTDPMEFFHKYVCGNFDEKETINQRRGTLLHTLLLEPEKFDSNYVIAKNDLKIPSDRELKIIQQVVLLAKTADLNDYNAAILQFMFEDNFHQNLKTDEQRLGKIITSDSNQYFAYLVESAGKEIITQSEYDRASLKAELMKLHPHYNNMIINSQMEDVKSEIELQCVFQDFIFKAIIDNLKISVPEKTIYITDVKSIGSTIEQLMKWDYEKYKYFIQAAICFLVVKHFIQSEKVNAKVPGIKDFQVKFTYFFIDGENLPYAIDISDPTMNAYITSLRCLIQDNVKYHFENFDFSKRFEYLSNSLVL